MATSIDSLDIRGFRKAHLRQLAFCVHIVTQQGIGYSPVKQFNKRQGELEAWADEILELCNDPDLRIRSK